MRNKGQLGDQMYLVYFVFLLIIITVAIVAGSYSAFGKPYDSRKVDAETLRSNILDCLAGTASLSEIKIRNLPITCDLDKTILDEGIIISISLNGKETFKQGDTVICGLQDRYPKGPRCAYGAASLKVDNVIQEIRVTVGSSIQ